MCQHVFLEVAIFCAFVFTLIADERFFSDMNKNVLFQMNRIGGREGTHWASVGFLSSRICFGFGCIIQLSVVFINQIFIYFTFVSLKSYGLTEGKSQEFPKENNSGKSKSELKYLNETKFHSNKSKSQ